MSLLELADLEPRNWKRVGDLYEVTRKPKGVNLSSWDTIPFTPMDAIPQGGSYKAGHVPRTPASITSGTYFERGDLLVAKITPSFENGKQALVFDLPTPFGYATTEVIPLRPRTGDQDRRLLFFYLLHPDVRHHVAERMEGTTGRQRVPENVLLQLPFPDIDPEEQSAMADALELLQRATTLEVQREKAARDLKRASMRALFTRGLRGEPQKETEIGAMPESWHPRTILDLCEIWSGGTPRKSVSEYWTGSIPWVSGKDLKVPTLHDVVDHVSESGVAAGSTLAPSDAVLLLVRGMGLAKDLPVARITRAMAFNQDVKALVSRGVFPGSFIRSAIYSGKDRLLSRVVPSAHGTMTLNLHDIETFKVPCPTNKEEGDEIVAILDAIDSKIDLHKRKRAVLDDLFKSLLHKLVTGEVRVSDLDFSPLGPATGQEVAA